MMKNNKNIGIVKTEYFTFADPPDQMEVESDNRLGPITLAYETYGKLNSSKNNAILIAHALSGDAHVAGFHDGSTKPGWWHDMIGPGKAFDTNKYYIICSNVIGGCKGSTGPSSVNPKTGKPYGLDFPLITIADMVKAQKHLIDHLGIKKILCIAGGSMGGMQVLQWVASFPEYIVSAIPIATALKHSPQQIALNAVGRQAIISDPKWKDGKYYNSGQPGEGLALARMIGHITYMSAESMEKKFSRNLKNGNLNFSLIPEFEVEGYLQHQGNSFVKRFDANSYLYITKAIDYFDLSDPDKITNGNTIKTKFLVISFNSDWLYPPSQSRQLVKILKQKGIEVSYCEINSRYGHDAFLVEFAEQTHLIKNFLKKIYSRIEDG
ncbi:MAG: homoserine O-acetyltransferase [Candidatus Humimicrobiaceae bacterium]